MPSPGQSLLVYRLVLLHKLTQQITVTCLTKEFPKNLDRTAPFPNPLPLLLIIFISRAASYLLYGIPESVASRGTKVVR